MSKINALAVNNSAPVTTKTALRTLIKGDPSSVKLLPVNPSPLLAYGRTVDNLPFGFPITVHVGKTTAEIERKFNGSVVVR